MRGDGMSGSITISISDLSILKCCRCGIKEWTTTKRELGMGEEYSLRAPKALILLILKN